MFTYISLIIAIIVLATGSALSVVKNKLTTLAGISAFAVGMAIYLGDGWSGLIILAAFFIMATLATAHKKEKKAILEAKQRHPERRKTGQVLANGGVAAFLGVASIALHYQPEISIMIASAISAATADTLASELGMVYGRNAVNIITFKREGKGLDGVISLEGTLLGVAGSLIIGLIYVGFHGFDLKTLLIIVVAGTLGNLVDSLLGAILERRRIIGNNTVNLLNTLTGALVAMIALILFC